MTQKPFVVPVILCGGSGSRLWPLSQDSMPKHFLALTGQETLLEKTLQRARHISNTIISVTTAQQEKLLRERSSYLESHHIVVEPCKRGTAAAIALAALHAESHIGSDTVLMIMPSDHFIGDDQAIVDLTSRAYEHASQGELVLFTIKPTRAEQGYGYIQVDQLHAARFVEKPSREVAENMFQEGTWHWNSGMLLCRTDILLQKFRTHHPDLIHALKEAGPKPSEMDYAKVPAGSFENIILEKESSAVALPLTTSWFDVGSWQSLWEVSAKDPEGNSITGQTFLKDSRNCLVFSQKRPVYVVGLEDIVVIETDDVIFVTKRNHPAKSGS